MNSTSPNTYAKYTGAFREGLQSAGYVEGETVTIEYRWAEGHNGRLPALAAELASQQVTVILRREPLRALSRRRRRPGRSRLFLSPVAIQSNSSWSTASIDQEVTSPVLAFLQIDSPQSNWIYCNSWRRVLHLLACW